MLSSIYCLASAAMTTVATLDPSVLMLPPGGEARCTLTIHNRGEIVEGYHLEVLGEAAGWARVEPASLRVYPGREGTATITFRMPPSVRPVATDIPFAIRVLPVERPADVVVPESVLRIGSLVNVSGELLPENSRTRRTATHEIAIDNLGNTPVRVELGASDADGELDFRLRPDDVVIPPGQAAIAQVRLRHRKTQWRGTPTPRRFQVNVLSPDAPPVVLAGTSVREPIVGPWLFKAAAALLVLALMLAGIWFGLLKRTVESTADKAAKVAVSEAAKQQADAAGGGGGGGGAKPSPSAGAGSGTGTTTPSPAPGAVVAPAAAPVDFHNSVTLTDAPGGTFAQVTFPRPVPVGTAYKVSWMLLSASQGDNGNLQVRTGDTVFMDVSLLNYRTNEFFPPHIVVPADKNLTVRLTCQAPGTEAGPATSCRALLTMSGQFVPKPTP